LRHSWSKGERSALRHWKLECSEVLECSEILPHTRYCCNALSILWLPSASRCMIVVVQLSSSNQLQSLTQVRRAGSPGLCPSNSVVCPPNQHKVSPVILPTGYISKSGGLPRSSVTFLWCAQCHLCSMQLSSFLVPRELRCVTGETFTSEIR
jgi:hypothetical protein